MPACYSLNNDLLNTARQTGETVSACLVKKGVVMQSNRCRHYQLETEFIPVPGAPVMLSIPIRRCHLAEHMIERLATSDNGRDIARKLMFPSAPHVRIPCDPTAALPESLPDSRRVRPRP